MLKKIRYKWKKYVIDFNYIVSLILIFFLKSGKGGRLFDIKFKVVPKLTSTKRYSPLPIISFS